MRPSGILICLLPVAVGAAYFALSYFGLYALQRKASARCLTYIKVLVCGRMMIKF